MSEEKMYVLMRRKCRHCHHEWWPRTDSRPRACPKCGRTTWDKAPRVNPCDCKRCGHHWLPYLPNPVICPSCKSPYWNVPRKAKHVTQPTAHNTLIVDVTFLSTEELQRMLKEGGYSPEDHSKIEQEYLLRTVPVKPTP